MHFGAGSEKTSRFIKQSLFIITGKMGNKPAIEGGKPVRPKYLVFGQPDIMAEDIAEVVKTLKSRWIGSGPKVKLFEGRIEHLTGAKFARAVNSCTAALHLSLIAAGVGPGDEVIVPSMTFAATANVVTHTGATPVLCDVEKWTGCIDPKSAEGKITGRTRAIMPVHLYGRPCDMDRIREISERHSLAVIEDAAHAIGAEYKGKKIGTLSPFTCFSFYVTKNITTAEGGAVTTASEEAAEKIEKFGLHGLSKGAWERFGDKGYKHYEVIYPGFKYNMTDVHASIGLHQLDRIADNMEKRGKIWKKYSHAFTGLPLKVPAEDEKGSVHARHLYTIELELDRLGISRDSFLEAMHRENIGTGVHYTALHLHKYYRERFGFQRNDFPNALHISERTISLPLSSALTGNDVKDVIDAVTKITQHYAK